MSFLAKIIYKIKDNNKEDLKKSYEQIHVKYAEKGYSNQEKHEFILGLFDQLTDNINDRNETPYVARLSILIEIAVLTINYNSFESQQQETEQQETENAATILTSINSYQYGTKVVVKDSYGEYKNDYIAKIEVVGPGQYTFLGDSKPTIIPKGLFLIIFETDGTAEIVNTKQNNETRWYIVKHMD